jgi:hypothetical protein
MRVAIAATSYPPIGGSPAQCVCPSADVRVGSNTALGRCRPNVRITPCPKSAIPLIAAIRGTGGYGISAVTVLALPRLDVGCPNHLGPFFGFVGNELAEFGGRERENRTTQVRKLLPHLGIGEGGVDLLTHAAKDRAACNSINSSTRTAVSNADRSHSLYLSVQRGANCRFPVPREIFPDTCLEIPCSFGREFPLKPLNSPVYWASKTLRRSRTCKISLINSLLAGKWEERRVRSGLHPQPTSPVPKGNVRFEKNRRDIPAS